MQEKRSNSQELLGGHSSAGEIKTSQRLEKRNTGEGWRMKRDRGEGTSEEVNTSNVEGIA